MNFFYMRITLLSAIFLAAHYPLQAAALNHGAAAYRKSQTPTPRPVVSPAAKSPSSNSLSSEESKASETMLNQTLALAKLYGAYCLALSHLVDTPSIKRLKEEAKRNYLVQHAHPRNLPIESTTPISDDIKNAYSDKAKNYLLMKEREFLKVSFALLSKLPDRATQVLAPSTTLEYYRLQLSVFSQEGIFADNKSDIIAEIASEFEDETFAKTLKETLLNYVQALYKHSEDETLRKTLQSDISSHIEAIKKELPHNTLNETWSYFTSTKIGYITMGALGITAVGLLIKKLIRARKEAEAKTSAKDTKQELEENP